MQSDYKPFGIIYKATAPNGRAYIGQTTQSFNARRNAHISAAHCNPKLLCRLFARALRKHGGDNFQWEILSRHYSKAELDGAETAAIAKHRTLAPHGYNLTTGGNETKWSDDSRQLARENMLRRWRDPNYRAAIVAFAKRPKSPEHIAAITAANTGRKMTPENLAKHRRAMQRRATDPQFKAQTAATTTAKWNDPDYRARHKAGWARKRAAKFGLLFLAAA